MNPYFWLWCYQQRSVLIHTYDWFSLLCLASTWQQLAAISYKTKETLEFFYNRFYLEQIYSKTSKWTHDMAESCVYSVSGYRKKKGNHTNYSQQNSFFFFLCSIMRPVTSPLKHVNHQKQISFVSSRPHCPSWGEGGVNVLLSLMHKTLRPCLRLLFFLQHWIPHILKPLSHDCKMPSHFFSPINRNIWFSFPSQQLFPVNNYFPKIQQAQLVSVI